MRIAVYECPDCGNHYFEYPGAKIAAATNTSTFYLSVSERVRVNTHKKIYASMKRRELETNHNAQAFTVDETAKKPLPVANIETEEKVDANCSPKESEEGIAKSEVHAASVGIDESANAEPVFVSRNKLLIDKQFRKSVPREKRAICERKIEELVRALDEGEELSFLKINDGKPMKGAKNVYKFRATQADRIIYVHTEDVPHLKDRYPDSIVLLRYADHDEQGSVATRVDLNSLRISEERRKKAYQTDFRFTDETSQRDCDEYFSEMVSNVINISQLNTILSSSFSNAAVNGFVSDVSTCLILGLQHLIVVYFAALLHIHP